MLPSPFQSARCGSVLIPRSPEAEVKELSTRVAAPWMIVMPGPYRAAKRRTIDMASFGHVQNRSPVTRILMNTNVPAVGLSV